MTLASACGHRSVPPPVTLPAAETSEDACGPDSAILCGPWVNVDVEARLWPQRSRAVRLQVDVTQGGYFAQPHPEVSEERSEPSRVRVTVEQADPGVTLGEPRPEPTRSARRAALVLPLSVDESRCEQGCEATLELRTRVCREPQSCHDVVRPVRIELQPEPSVPSRLGFDWY